MKENNVIIAKWMGDRDKILCDPKWMKGDELVYLRYHLSWDWLMPVVEKIENLHSSNFKYDMNQIASGNWPEDNEYMQVIALPLATPIDEAYAEVVKFIQWYTTKQQEKTPQSGSQDAKPDEL